MKSARNTPPPSLTGVQEDTKDDSAPQPQATNSSCKRKHADSDVVSDSTNSTIPPDTSCGTRPVKRSKCDIINTPTITHHSSSTNIGSASSAGATTSSVSGGSAIHAGGVPSTPPPSGTGVNPPSQQGVTTTTAREKPPSRDHQQTLTAEENKTTLWIGDLERWEDEEYIYHLFNNMTPKSVISVKIARDREHQKSLGYGFIDFASREIAEQILQAAPAIKRPYGRRFKLTWAKGKTRQPYNPANSTYTTPVNPVAPSSSSSAAAPSWFPSHSLRNAAATTPTTIAAPVDVGAEWISDIKNCPVSTDAYKVRQQVLRPSGVEPGVAFVEMVQSANAAGEERRIARIGFTASEWFFRFLQCFPEGTVTLENRTLPLEVPPAVMERWTRLYEDTCRLQRPTYGATFGVR
eukprot:Blabericola_migrator_1__944@NODE_1236_length_5021_cov_406_391805_g836_i0_p2_GENE_NODE_1236_length_5021_cov_406_391805_g836_i0NODE_1236_length_5021_cov_406_391805_g836_i0_p2_ORF_typecomplete_len407_score36_92RRM_1/PF00076_22/6_8e08RRM_1/PF00076_22/2_6e02PHM7_cyt/PF14703_6/6_8PHM7_cyt/PF14703_6/2PHM7_cyt/PF14703_6/3_7e03_NODE_1236_length_5021_cov_406_391805_g836_i09412161